MLTNNLFLKILALLLAILLWMYVMGEVDPVTTKTVKNVPVEVQHKSSLKAQDLTIKGNDTFTKELTISGKRSALNDLPKSKIILTADLEESKAGKNEIPVTVELPDGITVASGNELTIQVEVEEIITVRKPLDVVFDGTTPKGTEPGQISTKPEGIEITGAKSVVDAVTSVQAMIEASQITEDVTAFYVSPAAIDKNGDPVKKVKLSAKTVEVRVALHYTKTVPLKIKTTGSSPKGYKVSAIEKPKKITIRGPQWAIQDIKQINTADIDVSKIKANKTIPVKPFLPNYIEVADQSKDLEVVIKIKKLTAEAQIIIDNLNHLIFAA